MSQSDARTPRRGGLPPSFGRAPDPDTQPDFSIKGGQAFHLVLHVDVIPSAESLEVLAAAIRETTRSAVLAGYAAAFTEMDAPDEGDQTPGGGDGGAPPG